MSWAPVTMRWPEKSTAWMSGLDEAKVLANGEMASSAERLKGLEGLVTTNPGPVGAAAKQGVEIGREALARQLGQAPSCVVLTPYQSGIGQGTGYSRFLSAPNLLEQMARKLGDMDPAARPAGEQYALSILFLSTRLDQFADALGRFNALMPMRELERAERRARYLHKLEEEKTEIPVASTTPPWQALPLASCTLLKAAKQSMSGQLSMLESYADSSPLDELAKLSAQKAAQQLDRDRQLADIKASLMNSVPDTNMRARLIGPGTDLQRELLAGEQPGHEWVLCAGVLLVGNLDGLSFVQELIGL